MESRFRANGVSRRLVKVIAEYGVSRQRGMFSHLSFCCLMLSGLGSANLVIAGEGGAVLQGDRLPGGNASVHRLGENAFSQPSANMSMLRKLDFSVGNSFFRNPWVIAPASTIARDGLGPLFNTNSCQSCHIKDGRGHAPSDPSDGAVSMLVRLSVPAKGEEKRGLVEVESGLPEPVYGGQFQDFAVPGVAAEGRISVSWKETFVDLGTGERVSLRTPQVALTNLQYGPMQADVMTSVRIAPPMIGLGLLEAITEADILLAADENDQNADGISGKANQVWDVQQQRLRLGRFGWKAGQPSLMQQNAAAFNGDLGLTSQYFINDHCTPAQKSCLSAPNGNDEPENTYEVSNNILQFVEFYTRNLAVPARRNVASPEVSLGESVFHRSGCASCHKPSFTTAVLPEQPEQSGQVIWPYTDMLLHDMGPALADNRPEFKADGQEWRTPPLWGIGLAEAVSSEAGFLHDGRARKVLEAILWHGGEAEQAKQQVIRLPQKDRLALLSFVNSL